MKKAITIDSAKSYVESLIGQNVDVKVNRGRNKIKRYKGIVSEAHPNVFVVKLDNDLFDETPYINVYINNIYLLIRLNRIFAYAAYNLQTISPPPKKKL